MSGPDEKADSSPAQSGISPSIKNPEMTVRRNADNGDTVVTVNYTSAPPGVIPVVAHDTYTISESGGSRTLKTSRGDGANGEYTSEASIACAFPNVSNIPGVRQAQQTINSLGSNLGYIQYNTGKPDVSHSDETVALKGEKNFLSKLGVLPEGVSESTPSDCGPPLSAEQIRTALIPVAEHLKGQQHRENQTNNIGHGLNMPATKGSREMGG